MRTRFQHQLPLREILPLVHAEMRRWERFEQMVMGTGGAPPGRSEPARLAGGGGLLDADLRCAADTGNVTSIHMAVNAGAGEVC
jgi:hypothetical protein